MAEPKLMTVPALAAYLRDSGRDPVPVEPPGHRTQGAEGRSSSEVSALGRRALAGGSGDWGRRGRALTLPRVLADLRVVWRRHQVRVALARSDGIIDGSRCEGRLIRRYDPLVRAEGHRRAR